MADPRGWFILGAIIGIVGGALTLFYQNIPGSLFFTYIGGFLIIWGIVDSLGEINDNTRKIAEIMEQLVEKEGGDVTRDVDESDPA